MKNEVLILYAKTKKKNLSEIQYHEYQRNLVLSFVKQGFLEMFKETFDEKKMNRSAYGKPYYELDRKCFFNISHCPGMVVAAVSNFEVGIDAETERPVKERTIQKITNNSEETYINMKNEGKNRRFLHIWTLKESIVKCTGTGLRVSLKDIPVWKEMIDPDFYIQGKKESEIHTFMLDREDSSSLLIDLWPGIIAVTVSACLTQEDIQIREIELA